MPAIPFTNNYTDLSSDRGYQFKFHCQKCGNGYMSTFRANRMGAAASAANLAASLFGGIFGRAAQSANAIQNYVAGPQHDSALEEAVREISILFKQCTRCGNWVCEPVCWNKTAGLCDHCAPHLEVAHAVPLTCPSCGARVQGGKFCPECGKSVTQRKKCAECGAEADGAPKFCPECGEQNSA